MNYQEIQQLFGIPLCQVPKPIQSSQLKTIHYVLIGAVVIFAGYGVFNVVKNISTYHKERNSKHIFSDLE
jgi:hypothetical protein